MRVLFLLCPLVFSCSLAALNDEAVRVVRLQILYDGASTKEVESVPKWSAVLKSSLLASLRFINKHWLICGGANDDKESSSDCGKAHVTGETLSQGRYRVNVTFIAERDPVRNAKVDATSTVFGVVQIGLKGGIFQYTNALKVLGKPSPDLRFDEKFFCYKGFSLSTGDKCVKNRVRRLSESPLEGL